MNRIYNNIVNIDSNKIKEFYSKRAEEKIDIHIDSPVVLCGDNDKNKIDEWTQFEIDNRIGLFEIDKKSKVIEIGFGTGRMSKYIIDLNPRLYVGIDYVEQFVEIAKKRIDIKKGEHIKFLNSSFRDFLKINNNSYNRFFISGGVLMYMNDDEINTCLRELSQIMEKNSIIYISEPIAFNNRLTLNEFYSHNLGTTYNAIYRNISEYMKLFKPLFDKGFYLTVNEEFFYDDIKKQRETKQWLFILKNK